MYTLSAKEVPIPTVSVFAPLVFNEVTPLPTWVSNMYIGYPTFNVLFIASSDSNPILSPRVETPTVTVSIAVTIPENPCTFLILVILSLITSGVGAKTSGTFVFVYPNPTLFIVTDAIDPFVIFPVATANVETPATANWVAATPTGAAIEILVVDPT